LGWIQFKKRKNPVIFKLQMAGSHYKDIIPEEKWQQKSTSFLLVSMVSSP